MWKSTHGLLYTNKDYARFQIKNDNLCHCGAEQNLEHIMINCRRTKCLFANFERQYELTEKLSDCEKIMGIDPNVKRSTAFYKRLNILRRTILQFNFRDEVLRWEAVLDKIDQAYVQEYSIADKNDTLAQHFKAWDR